MNPPQTANLVDVHVGSRIRLRREAMGLSCGALAGMLGMAPEDVAAIEDGGRRARAEDLYDLARILDVKVGFFFDYATASDAAERATRQQALAVRLTEGMPG